MTCATGCGRGGEIIYLGRDLCDRCWAEVARYQEILITTDESGDLDMPKISTKKPIIDAIIAKIGGQDINLAKGLNNLSEAQLLHVQKALAETKRGNVLPSVLEAIKEVGSDGEPATVQLVAQHLGLSVYQVNGAISIGKKAGTIKVEQGEKKRQKFLYAVEVEV